MSNKVKFGLRNVCVAFYEENKYGAPIHIPGAVNLTLDPAGESNDFYADDTIYYHNDKNNGYTGSVEFALLPDDVKVKMLGWYKDTNGNVVEDADGKPVSYALMFEVQGDAEARRTVIYDCQSARPSLSAATQESSATPQTDTLNLTAKPHEFEIGAEGSKETVKLVQLTCHKGDKSYDSFMNAVVEPAAKSAA